MKEVAYCYQIMATPFENMNGYMADAVRFSERLN